MGSAVTAEKPNPQDVKPLPQAWLQGGTLATTSWQGKLVPWASALGRTNPPQHDKVMIHDYLRDMDTTKTNPISIWSANRRLTHPEAFLASG